jgi:hypothetical protein
MWATLSRKRTTASAFTASDWKILAEAYFILLAVRFQVLFSPRRSLAKALAVQPLRRPRDKSDCSKERLLTLLGIASRYQGMRPNCLPVAVAQQALLLRHGFFLPLQIGVRKRGEAFSAHAWCQGAESAASWMALEQERKQA